MKKYYTISWNNGNSWIEDKFNTFSSARRYLMDNICSHSERWIIIKHCLFGREYTMIGAGYKIPKQFTGRI